MLAVVAARTRHLPDDALDAYRALCRRVGEDPRMGPLETLRRLFLFPKLFDPIGHMVLFVNATSLRFVFWIRVLQRMLARWAPGVRPDADVLLGSGSEGVLSAEMGRGIGRLAKEAERSPRVRELLLAVPPQQALHALREEPEARGFLGALDAFLAVNGHRALKEFELRSARWEEDPAPVLGMLRNHLLAPVDPEAHERKGALARVELWDALRARLGAGLRLRAIRYVAERVKYFLKLRENSRFFHIMCFGVVRKKVLRAEVELIGRGQLRCKDDVFFLRLSELQAMQAGRLGWRDVEDRIRERRIEQVRLTKLGPPKTLGFELKKRPAPESEAGGLLLRGNSASPGRYEGAARVILDPSVDAQLLPGEVLIAPYTDPAWTPLFLTAGAAVVEVGSYLSHAGTVAREFGMPCVVDVAEATRRIRTGDRVAVDGEAGSVRLLA
jgi:pyruvate,water dikinase